MEINETVTKRLGMLGYTVAIDRAEQRIIDDINQSEVPRGLRFVWADMAAGQFLSDMKAAGRLTGGAFDFSAPVESVKMGDTTTAFAVSSAQSPEARFDKMLSGMMNPPPEKLAAYRKVQW